MNKETILVALITIGALAALGILDRALDRISAKFAAAMGRFGHHSAPRPMPRWLKWTLVVLWVAFVVWCCNPSEAVAKQGHDQQAGAERTGNNFNTAVFREVPANFNSADEHDGEGQNPQERVEHFDAHPLKARREFERACGNACEGEQRQADKKLFPFHAPASPETLGESIA